MSDTVRLTDSQIEILGKPNFACARVAKLLIAGRLYENKVKKAEYEQAVFIHWASDLMETHGDNWKGVGENILTGISTRLREEAVLADTSNTSESTT